jgi:hypothetical protein
MSIKRWIRNWLLNENVALSMGRTADVEGSPEHGAQISIAEAINGRVLTIRTYNPTKNPNRNDWISEHYVLKDDESLPEAITMLLLLKGLK